MSSNPKQTWYRALPFGDLWCVVFTPNGDVKGLCAICASRAIAEAVVLKIDALPAKVQIDVSLTGPSHASSVVPCVIFRVPEGGRTLDWFGGRVLTDTTPKEIADASNYCPLLDTATLHQFVPTNSPYPLSLAALQVLLSKEAEAKLKAEEKKRERAQEELKREREESERKLEQERVEKRKAAELRQANIQSQRKSSNRCMMCGKPLGLLLRLLNKERHKQCIDFIE